MNIINQRLSIYKRALEHWEIMPEVFDEGTIPEVDKRPENFTEDGFCYYFANHYDYFVWGVRAFYDIVYMPELWNGSEEEKHYPYHFPSHGASKEGRLSRIKALKKAIKECETKIKDNEQ